MHVVSTAALPDRSAVDLSRGHRRGAAGADSRTASCRAPRASLDAVVAAAQARYPGARPLFASQEPHDDSIWYVTVRGAETSPRLEQAAVDAVTAEVLGEPRMAENGVMGAIRSLHVDLFAGQRGALFLGAMGMVFLASLVSGLVLYAPFLRHRPVRCGACRGQ